MNLCSPPQASGRPWTPSQGRIIAQWGMRLPPIVRCRPPMALPRGLASSLDFAKVKTEDEFLATLSGAEAAGVLPGDVARIWRDFYFSYKEAVLGSGRPEATEALVVEVQASIAERVLVDMADPYTFPSYHERVLAPYNYFEFGQRYAGALIDFQNSVVGHLERWDGVDTQIEAGHNVVLLANHQTEADPAVFAHMLGATHPRLAQDVIYVAGDRVVTDAMCKPFSMGRNLFCVHSKKHMDDVPELREEKMANNRRTLAVMARKMNAGGLLMWIAPSGGRDRPDDAGAWRPAPFDAASVEICRKLATRSKAPGHLYPMAMLSWGMMPPPKTTSKALGERRITNYSGVGVSLCEELELGDTAGQNGSAEGLAGLAEARVVEEYNRLVAAVGDPRARGTMPECVQPWLRTAVGV
eukprot:evm.model.scf_1861EXC.1 EVM.evm.TU.scf_1861EXC.1   scf_1861EXC:4626-5861(-)